MGATGGVGVWSYLVASDQFFCDAAISELYGLEPERAALGIPRLEFLQNVHPDDIAALTAWLAAQPVPAASRPAETLPAPMPLLCGVSPAPAAGGGG